MASRGRLVRRMRVLLCLDSAPYAARGSVYGVSASTGHRWHGGPRCEEALRVGRAEEGSSGRRRERRAGGGRQGPDTATVAVCHAVGKDMSQRRDSQREMMSARLAVFLSAASGVSWSIKQRRASASGAQIQASTNPKHRRKHAAQFYN